MAGVGDLSTGDYVDFCMMIEDYCCAEKKARDAIAERDSCRLDVLDRIQELGLQPDEMVIFFEGSKEHFVVKWNDGDIDFEQVRGLVVVKSTMKPAMITRAVERQE